VSRISLRALPGWLPGAMVLAGGWLSTTLVVAAAPTAPPTRSIAVNGIEVRAGGVGTVQVIVDGATLSNESRLYCISPDWKRRYYGFEDDKDLNPNILVEKDDNGVQRLILPLNGQGSGFGGHLVYEARPDRILSITLHAKISAQTTASLENRLLTIPVSWLAGRSVTVRPGEKSGPGLINKLTRKGVTTGYAPLVAVSDEVPGATIAGRFESIQLDSRLGPITMESSGTLPLSLVDYRRNKWAQGALYYWFGVLDHPLQQNGTGSYSILIRFPQSPDNNLTQAASVNALRPASQLLSEASTPDRILPTPKSIEWLDGIMPLPQGSIIIAGGNGDANRTDTTQERMAANRLSTLLRQATGLQYRVATDSPSTRMATARIQVQLASLPNLERVRADRYRIRFQGQRHVILEAPTTQGLQAATFTLLQLLRQGPSLRRADIDDGATLPFRGIHFFTGRNAGKLQQRFVTDILGPLKINHLLWQVDYLKWESFPQIHHATYGMDKTDAALVRDASRQMGINLIPLVNTFGHSEWLLNNDALRHLADNPENPYAYDPSNPQTIPTVEKVYEEAIAFFQPTDFHIGHDEITNEDFPRREANIRKGVRQLIEESIDHWHGYLAKRGIRTHLWGDMFLHSSEANDAGFADSPEDAAKRRKTLPNDITIHDWHYGPDPVDKFISLRVLNQAGLDTIAATWMDGRNIGRFATAATREAYRQDRPSTVGQTLGHLQTTWAGYSFDEGSLENNPDQYAAYVLAAEASWNGGFDDPKDLPYDYRAEFARLWNRELLPNGPAPGWMADLNPAANFEATPRSKGEIWLGAPGAHGMDGLTAGENRLGRWLFHIPGTGRQPRAVHFQSLFHQGPGTQRLSLPIQRATKAIQFAIAATFPGPQGEQIAHSIIHYVDGTSVTIPWKLGLTVFAIDDDRETFQAPVLWRRKAAKDDAPRCMHGYLWTNPRPKTPIRTIETLSDNRASGLLVFAVSGVNP
jgi:hexosaminidase